MERSAVEDVDKASRAHLDGLGCGWSAEVSLDPAGREGQPHPERATECRVDTFHRSCSSTSPVLTTGPVKGGQIFPGPDVAVAAWTRVCIFGEGRGSLIEMGE